MKPVLTAWKYNIEVREVQGTGKTWMIFEDFLNKGIENPIKVDHIEINCNMHTSEKFYDGLNFCLVAEGSVRFEYSPVDGSKYAIIEDIND